MATKTKKTPGAPLPATTTTALAVVAPTNKVTLGQIAEAAARLKTTSANFAIAFDDGCRLALARCEDCGDTSGIAVMYEAIGETGPRIGKTRQKVFLAWLKAVSPVRLNAKTGTFQLQKKEAKTFTPFDMEAANSMSVLDYGKDTAPKGPTTYTMEQANKRLTRIAQQFADSLVNDEGETIPLTESHQRKLIATFRAQLKAAGVKPETKA